MKKIITLFFFLIAANIFLLKAQNLVPNSSFDVQDSCPSVSEFFVCKPWNTPTLGTPDACNSTCPTQNISGHTGIGSAGIYLLNTFQDNREYMQAPLASPLSAGQMYYVSFWVKRVNYRYAVNRIGAYFSVGAVNDMTTTSVLSYTPQVQNPSTKMLSSSGWVAIGGSFTASGGEDHIIIGNFSNDSQTDTVVANASNSSKVAFYQVDDVSVTVTGNGVNDIHSNDLISIFPNPSSGKFNLEALSLKKSEIRIYNPMGEEVYDSLLSNGMEEMDLSALPKGIYFIRMDSGETEGSQKIIIQ